MAAENMQSSDIDGLVTDVGLALGRVLPRDGSAPMSGALNVGDQTVNNVARALTTSDATPYEQAQNLFVIRPTAVTRDATQDSTPGGDQGTLLRYSLTFDQDPTLVDGLTLLFDLPADVNPVGGGGLEIALPTGGGKYVSTPNGDAKYYVPAQYPMLVVFSEELDKWIWLSEHAVIPPSVYDAFVEHADLGSVNQTRPSYSWDLDATRHLILSRPNTAQNAFSRQFEITLSGGTSGVSYKFFNSFPTANNVGQQNDWQPDWVAPLGKSVYVERVSVTGTSRNRWTGAFVEVTPDGDYAIGLHVGHNPTF